MLKHLYVRHFAVVEEAEIAVGDGLTVISGETGAGKSLLVDALMLLSGTRADSALVRAGHPRAELSAEFDLGDQPRARAWLVEHDLDDDDACQLRRVLKAEGSSRAWINGRPATLAQLGELASLLVEIHGQHEHQTLLSRSAQLDLLDDFAGALQARADLADCVTELRAIDKRMRELGGGGDRQARIDLLHHEVQQLDQWAMPAAKLDELDAEHRRLANADRLLEGANAAVELLDGDNDFAVTRALARAQASLERLLEVDPDLGQPHEFLGNAGIQLAEAVAALNQYASSIEGEPQRLTEVEEHLARLQELARRHRLPVTQLSDKQAELATELEQLQGAGAELQQLASDREACLKRCQSAADALGRLRRQGATNLGTGVSQLMQQLGMPGGGLEVALTTQAGSDPDPLGGERCQFMVSANPGQPARPLRTVASGGELSRISLALRVAALDVTREASMVFDEVDSGIGGAVAEVVGRKLRALGDKGQVLCVTHLPQVAAQAHAHLKVSKSADGGDTHTRVEALDDSARCDEIARMLGGIEITPETEAHARQMIDSAQQKRG